MFCLLPVACCVVTGLSEGCCATADVSVGCVLLAGPATGAAGGYQDAASVAARGTATVAASGLFCHATIARLLGAGWSAGFHPVHNSRAAAASTSRPTQLPLPPPSSLRRTRLISHLANVSLTNRPKSRLHLSSFNGQPEIFRLGPIISKQDQS